MQGLFFIIMDVSYNIKSWAEDDRPREKMISKGRAALSDAELLAILLRSGTKRESAVDLAKKILAFADDNLMELSKMNLHDFMAVKGIGEAKALSIIAALELGRRRAGSDVKARMAVNSSKDVFDYFQMNLADNAYEEFWILLLSRANKIIRKIPISTGGISGTIADPRKIFKAALEHNAVSIILCHNHPSGNTKPSETDIKLTKKLKDAGQLLDISVLDHIIAGDNSFFSFADEGLM